MFIKIYVLYVYSAPRLVLPLCDVADGFVEDFLRRPLASVIASYLCGNCNYGDDIGVSPNEATQSQRGWFQYQDEQDHAKMENPAFPDSNQCPVADGHEDAAGTWVREAWRAHWSKLERFNIYPPEV